MILSMALARSFPGWTGSNKREITGSGHDIFRVRIFSVPFPNPFFLFFIAFILSSSSHVCLVPLSIPFRFPSCYFSSPSIALLPCGGRVQLISLTVCHLQGSKKNNRPRYAQCYLIDIPKVRILLECKQTLLTYIAFL